jgi:Na+/H+ antiporter NhaC
MKKVLLLMLLLVASFAFAEEVADAEHVEAAAEEHVENSHAEDDHEEEHSNVGYIILVFVAIVGGRYYLKSKARK